MGRMRRICGPQVAAEFQGISEVLQGVSNSLKKFLEFQRRSTGFSRAFQGRFRGVQGCSAEVSKDSNGFQGFLERSKEFHVVVRAFQGSFKGFQKRHMLFQALSGLP